MSKPTPTPRTDAATYRADCLGATLVTNRDLARALEIELAAANEACRVASEDALLMRDDLYKQLAAATAERDQLRAELAAEREKVTMLLSDAYALTKNWHDRAEKAEAEAGRLRAGIAECLHTNGHLADGEDCTLIGLKRCLRDPNAARESNGGAA